MNFNVFFYVLAMKHILKVNTGIQLLKQSSTIIVAINLPVNILVLYYFTLLHPYNIFKHKTGISELKKYLLSFPPSLSISFYIIYLKIPIPIIIIPGGYLL